MINEQYTDNFFEKSFPRDRPIFLFSLLIVHCIYSYLKLFIRRLADFVPTRTAATSLDSPSPHEWPDNSQSEVQ